jgi:hypothetical protein
MSGKRSLSTGKWSNQVSVDATRCGEHEIANIILLAASKSGLSSMLWGWSSRITVRNYELGLFFSGLYVLCLMKLPMAIVNNQFPTLNHSFQYS